MLSRLVRTAAVFVSGVTVGLLSLPKVQTLPVPTAHAETQAPPPPSGREIASRALAATVFLRGGNVYGAGVLLDGHGHVLTCDHVIDGLDHVEASFDGDDAPIGVKVVARAKDVDLALLQLDHVPEKRTPLAAGSVTRVEMGDTLYAMGAPRKMRFSLSHGIASYVGRQFDGTFYVQTDLAANGGSSGGPVLDERGELVGLSSFILHGSEGLTFAVPIDYAFERFASELTARDGRRFHEWIDAESRAVPSKT